MALHAAPAALPAGALPGHRRRPGRLRGALLVVLAVLGWHLLLADRLADPVPPAAGRTPAPRPAAVQLQVLAPPARPPEVAAVPPVPAAPLQRTATPAARQPVPPVTPVRQVPAARPGAAAPSEVPSPVLAPGPDIQAAPAPAVPAEAATPAPASDGEAPPPLYATRLPAPVSLRYAVDHNGRPGEALLQFQHDGQRYRLTLQASGAAGEHLLLQTSQGWLDVNGLAPERFTDRRRSGAAQAANFRRDTGRIGWSGPAHTQPAWAGAQDRLSWLAQLAAVLAAAHAAGDAAPTLLEFFVADARGHASAWQLQRQPDEAGPTPWGEAALQHWQREPPRPEGLRVQLWLAADPAAAPSALWPLRLRLSAPRSGDVFELRLLAPP